jgi:hypothetical protein
MMSARLMTTRVPRTFSRAAEPFGHNNRNLRQSDGAANDNFGSAVAIDTDTAIVGATGSDTGGNTDQGAAYVFTRSLVPAVWSERQKLTAGDGAAFDGFGNAVAVIAQVFVIGANLDDLGSVPNAGSAYIAKRRQRLCGDDTLALPGF